MRDYGASWLLQDSSDTLEYVFVAPGFYGAVSEQADAGLHVSDNLDLFCRLGVEERKESRT